MTFSAIARPRCGAGDVVDREQLLVALPGHGHLVVRVTSFQARVEFPDLPLVQVLGAMPQQAADLVQRGVPMPALVQCLLLDPPHHHHRAVPERGVAQQSTVKPSAERPLTTVAAMRRSSSTRSTSTAISPRRGAQDTAWLPVVNGGYLPIVDRVCAYSSRRSSVGLRRLMSMAAANADSAVATTTSTASTESSGRGSRSGGGRVKVGRRTWTN